MSRPGVRTITVPRGRRSVLLGIGVGAAALAVLTIVASSGPVGFVTSPPPGSGSPPTLPPLPTTSTTATPANAYATGALNPATLPPIPGWVVALIQGAFVLVVLAAGLWLLRFAWQHAPRARSRVHVDHEIFPLPDLPEELTRSAAARMMLLQGGTPRNAIVACWLDLEDAAGAVGLPRLASETSADYTTRVLKTWDLAPDAPRLPRRALPRGPVLPARADRGPSRARRPPAHAAPRGAVAGRRRDRGAARARAGRAGRGGGRARVFTRDEARAPGLAVNRLDPRALPKGRRRLLAVVAAYLVLLALLQALDLSPSPLLIAALFVAVGSVLLYVDGRLNDSAPSAWPRLGASTLGLGRGADHRTTSLARRLAALDTATAGSRRQLALDIHAQVVQVLVGRARRVHGRDVLTDPTARALLPADLALLLADPVDEQILDRLVDPPALTRLLDRIESL